MHWKLTRAQYEKHKGAGNRRKLREEVASGSSPGLLAYDGRTPVGWCRIGPRDEFSTLDRSRVLKRVDDQPVWSVPCFFVARDYRGRGVSTALLRAASEHARKKGAKLLEGYPVEPKKRHMPELFAFTGLASMFFRQGFKEVARRSETRPIVRRPV